MRAGPVEDILLGGPYVLLWVREPLHVRVLTELEGTSAYFIPTLVPSRRQRRKPPLVIGYVGYVGYETLSNPIGKVSLILFRKVSLYSINISNTLLPLFSIKFLSP